MNSFNAEAPFLLQFYDAPVGGVVVCVVMVMNSFWESLWR